MTKKIYSQTRGKKINENASAKSATPVEETRRIYREITMSHFTKIQWHLKAATQPPCGYSFCHLISHEEKAKLTTAIWKQCSNEEKLCLCDWPERSLLNEEEAEERQLKEKKIWEAQYNLSNEACSLEEKESLKLRKQSFFVWEKKALT